jgi:two-component system, OmpR family, KDP operon response regulator KdpE
MDQAASEAFVLIVAPQPMAAVLAQRLEADGHRAAIQDRADGVLRAVYAGRPAAIVLGAHSDGGNTSGLLSRIRDVTSTPVLVVGESADEDAVVSALGAGADDYMAGPLRLEEFAARVEVLLRRETKGGRATRGYSDELLEIDFENVNVRAAGRDVLLTPIEFRLLTAFVQNSRRMLGTRELLELVWGDPDLPHARVKLYVGYLRRKLEQAGAGDPIKTARGFGYRYDSRPAPAAHAGLRNVSALDPVLDELEELRGPKGQPFFPSRTARLELVRSLTAV